MKEMSVKDLEKFVKHFVLKCVQVIVQSRLGSQRMSTHCNPKGNDWFNLAIVDIKEINEMTKKCIESMVSEEVVSSSLISVNNDWKICCEISLKTNEGNSMILEYWFLSNETSDDQNESAIKTNSPTLVIYNVYNRMSLMLKSLISLTRSTPAYKLSVRGQSAESYVICYRVYRCDSETNVFNCSEESQHFSSLKQLGSIKSAFNELYVSLQYRTDMTIGPKTCIDSNTSCTVSIPKSPQLLPLKNDHFKREDKIAIERDPSQPLKAAFAVTTNTNTESLSLLPEAPFSKLLSSEDTVDSKKTISSNTVERGHIKSDPICIPSNNKLGKSSIASSPVYSSSGDSFVFVELKTPFAPEEQHELGSFFNGPSPTFTSSVGESIGDLSELTVKLAELESNAQQWDSFVESICLPENEDEAKCEI